MDSSIKYVHPVLARITANTGEMGSLIRSYSWDESVLGPIEKWPPSLITTLSLILHSKFPMFLFWEKDLICFYNDAYRPSLGNNGKHPEALGSPAKKIWSEIWKEIKPVIDFVFSDAHASWNEDRLLPILRNGQMEDAYWTSSYSPVMDETGQICGVLVTCVETTHKVKTQAELIESRDQLSFAIEATELAVWDYQPDTNKFTGSRRLKKWFGLTDDQEIDLSNAINAIAEKDRLRVSEAIQNALLYGSGGDYDIEYTILNQLTNHQRIVRAKGKVSYNPHQQAYRFNGTLQDVTREVTVKKQLADVAEKMQLAVDAGNLGSYELVLDSGQIMANARCKQHLGLQLTDELSYDTFLEQILPQDREDVQQKITTALATHSTYNAEYRIQTGVNDIKWVKAAGNPVYNDQGEPVKMIGITLDITEQKEFAQELTRQVIERTTELHRSNEDLLQFAHVTSHDLKEPVRKIRIFTNRIQDELGDVLTPKGMRYLEKIQKSSARITSMIEGVLAYSQLNGIQRHNEPVDLNELITDIKDDLEILIKEKNAVLIHRHLPKVEGTALLLYQLFYNIVNNALKFSSADRQPVISISYQTVQHPVKSYRIIFEDNGIGFDNVFKEEIFNTFTRLNSKDAFEGTGLGLALCKKIVERHQGKIQASAHIDVGTTIIVELPLHQRV